MTDSGRLASILLNATLIALVLAAWLLDGLLGGGL
jgi:hypothetical protein